MLMNGIKIGMMMMLLVVLCCVCLDLRLRIGTAVKKAMTTMKVQCRPYYVTGDYDEWREAWTKASMSGTSYHVNKSHLDQLGPMLTTNTE